MWYLLVRPLSHGGGILEMGREMTSDCSWVLQRSDLLNKEPVCPLVFTQRSKMNCPLLSLLRDFFHLRLFAATGPAVCLCWGKVSLGLSHDLC